MTLVEIKEAMGVAEVENINVYSISMQGNPFVDVASKATADVAVARIEGVVYAATLGTITSDVATPILA